MLALEIALDQITIPAGRRAVDGAAVERLKESIAVVGLQHPITVRELDGAYVLVAGAHRFAAFGKLNMQKIPANVVDLNVLEAELFEIDENFARKELSEGERSLSHARREEIYRALNGKSGRRYDEVAAEATGQSARSVRRDVARGKALGQDMLAKVVGTSLDKGTELDALTKLPVAERESLVARAAAGELFGDRQAAGKASGARCDAGSPCGGWRGRGAGSVRNARPARRRCAVARVLGAGRPRYRDGFLFGGATRRRDRRESARCDRRMAAAFGVADRRTFEGFRKLGIGGNHNPKGVGGFLPGQTGNAGGRPAVNSKLQIWFLSRAREAGEIVVEIAHNKQATKSDAIRLQACREILDRGMGKAPQSLSLSLERALDKPLTAMSLEELEAVREQFRALDSAAPALLEHMIEKEEQAELPGLGDDSETDNDPEPATSAAGAEE